MIEALQFEFIRHALMAGLLASIICGVMGTLVVVNRIAFLSGGIAHAAYGGIGLALYLGWNYLVCTIGFSLGAAMLMALVSIKLKHRSDTIIGVIWALGMAFGIILVDLTPGYNVDLMSYLFGSILTVPAFDLAIMLVICLVTIGFVTFYYQGLIAFSYDEEFAQIRGVPVKMLYFTLIGILAVAIVMLIQVVGLILVIALLTIPPFIAEKYTRSLVQMMLASSLLGAVFTVSGLWLAYLLNLTSGASIILVAGGVFFLDFLFDLLKKRFRRMLRTGLIMLCVVFFAACTHHSVTQPNPSPYEDLLGIYRGPLNHLAAVRRGVCPMHPSCSEYSRQAVEKHGFTLGWAMAMDRLLRCGRDELRRAPAILVNGEWKFHDPLSANDNWWYSAGEDINP